MYLYLILMQLNNQGWFAISYLSKMNLFKNNNNFMLQNAAVYCYADTITNAIATFQNVLLLFFKVLLYSHTLIQAIPQTAVYSLI